MRADLKKLGERLSVGSGMVAVARRFRRHRVVIVAYHNVVPDGEPVAGERSLQLPQREFGRQLDVLRETYNVVPLSTSLLTPEVASERPMAVITIDDAYRGAVTAGVAELARCNLPATIFVPPGFVGGATFWWDELADRDTGRVSPEIRQFALAELRGDSKRIVAWARREGLTVNPVPDHARCASEEELREAEGLASVTFGSHTWGHPNLTRLAAAELKEELSRSSRWLSEHLSAWIPWLAYPYGLSSPPVEREVTSRYEGALLIGGGLAALQDRDTRLRLPRVNVPSGLSLDGFRLRSVGFRSR